MEQLNRENQALLHLLRNSFWLEQNTIPEDVNWEVLDDLAKKQAVLPIVYDGAVKAGVKLPDAVRQSWKAQVLRGVIKNELLMQAQDQLVQRFADAAIPVVVLKGSGVARYYPQPDLRRLGDIDILVRKQDLDVAQKLITELGYREYEAEHDFHIGYSRENAYVELHYHVTSLPDSPGGLVAQDLVSHFLDAPQQVTVGGHAFPVLQEMHQALSLLLHMIRHMFQEGIGLRQLCDWMVFVNANADSVAERILPVLMQCGLAEYAKAATKSCVRFLGLQEEHLVWCGDVCEETCQLFIDAVFRGGNMGRADQDGMGSLFTDAKSMGNKRSTSLFAMISKLNALTYMHFPFVKRWKVLLPFFWVFLPVRYLVRAMFGLRPKKSVVRVVASAKKQRDLYEGLKLFEIDE